MAQGLSFASVIISIFTLLTGVALLYMSKSMVEMREQLAVVSEFKGEGPRFSAIDAAEAHKSIISETVVEINKDFPPKWLVRELDGAVEDNKRLHAGQENLQDQIDRWEGLLDEALVERCEP